jgi:hypothetical protein
VNAAGAKMEQAVALNAWGRRLRLKMPWWFWNLFGEQAVFLEPPELIAGRHQAELHQQVFILQCRQVTCG